jgi:chromosome partitioning protein
MHVIAVANRKGGVGKSTITTNLAAALGLDGKRVLVVDLDSQGSATKTLLDDAPTDPTMAHVVVGSASLADVVRPSTAENVWIAPATAELTHALLAIVSKTGRETILRRSLRTSNDFDLVLIDTPPETGLGTVNALVASTHVLMPFGTDPVGIEGLGTIAGAVTEIADAEIAQPEILGCVQVAHDTRLGVSTSARHLVGTAWESLMFNALLRFNTNFVLCPAVHRSIFAIEKTTRPPRRGSDDVRALAAEVWSRLTTSTLATAAA